MTKEFCDYCDKRIDAEYVKLGPFQAVVEFTAFDGQTAKLVTFTSNQVFCNVECWVKWIQNQ